MKISLEKVMVIFAVILAALPILIMGVFVWLMNVDIESIASSEFNKIALRTTRQVVDNALKTCRIIHKTYLDEDIKARASMRLRFDSLGTPRVWEKKNKVRVSSQSTPFDFKMIDLPVFSFGSTPLRLKIEKDGTIVGATGKIEKILESLKNDTSLDFTIFIRINENGNMLRIASTVAYMENSPYIGTYIPSTGGVDDGGIVRTLLARKTYSTISHVGNTGFIVNYEPILDSYGDVIGAFAYGRSQESIAYLMKYFETIRVGTTGTVWAIELVGRGESVIRVSRDGKQNGMIIEADTYTARRDKTLEMVSEAVTLGDKIAVREYKLGLENNVSDVIAAYSYFKPWNLVIGASTHKGDFDLGVEKIVSTARYFIILLVSVGIVILFFAGFLAWLAAKRGVNMANALETIIGKIKNGDIALARRELVLITNPKKWNNSELYRFAVALDLMSKSLSNLVFKVQISSKNLADNAAIISKGVANIDDISNERSESLSEVSATINSIAKSVVLLNADTREAAKNIEESLSVLNNGSSLVSRLNENSAPLLSAADSVASRLAVIKEKTERISASISTISIVGERTNMLSLNAAIESERAGEFGGFESVSAEISKLADQTEASAMNVSKIVADMTDSVESGVADMNNFSEKMKLNFEMIRKLNSNMATAESQIAELGPKFESLALSIASQDENISNIGTLVDALESLAEGEREKVEMLKEITASIFRTSELLVEKVSRFNLDSNDSHNE